MVLCFPHVRPLHSPRALLLSDLERGHLVTIEEYCRLLDQEVPVNVVLASSYLQAKGLKFAVDFGIENAEEKAEQIYSECA